MFQKKCPTPGCDFLFTLSGKPHDTLTGICPKCGTTVGLADAAEIKESKSAAAKAAPEAK